MLCRGALRTLPAVPRAVLHPSAVLAKPFHKITILSSIPTFIHDTTPTRRPLHTSAPLLSQSPEEEALVKALATAFPAATDIAVVDISGGCGSMYEVFVEAPDFRGVRLVKQHQLVTAALKAEIGDMHGIRIATQASPGCGGSEAS
jgi:stress-induced morphogen